MTYSDPPSPRATTPPPTDPLAALEASGAALDAVATLLNRSQRSRAISDYLDTLALHTAWRVIAEGAKGRPSEQLDAEVRSFTAEVGIATRSCDRTVMRRLDRAIALHERFPRTASAFGTGAVTGAHVDALIDEGRPIEHEPALVAEYEAELLERAEECTPAQLRAAARKVVAELDPASFAERHARARSERYVRVRDLDDGMSLLTAYLPSTVAHAIDDRLTELARSCRRERDAFGRDQPGSWLGPPADAEVAPWCRCTGEPGCACRPDDSACGCDAPDLAVSSGQALVRNECAPGNPEAADDLRDHRWFHEIRSDALADLLLAGQLDAASPHAAVNSIRGRVAITVPALALLGVDDEPAMLDGVGPIPLDAAKTLCAGASVWVRLLTDPATGEAITADTYRPSAELRRFIETRDQHCRAPGCRRPAVQCDFDHTRAWAEGGATSSTNGAMLCRRHHTMKHRGWTLLQSPRGELTWISPHGRRRTSAPLRAARRWTPQRLAEFGIGLDRRPAFAPTGGEA